jgi:hypothetical protein
MIDLLRRELADLEYLSPEQQEELALFIAALRLERESVTSEPPSDPKPTDAWRDPAGAWSDLPEDDEAETFYRMRHETAPSTPVDL